ncbi:MAG: PAS domain S-box protein [Nitrospinae bacterium]|nr:PAS domain S-box protein [Nitrospinota bacterium]
MNKDGEPKTGVSEQVGLAVDQLPTSIIVSLFNCAVSVAVLWGHVSTTPLAVWITTVVFAALGRAAVLRAYRRAPLSHTPEEWQRLLFVLALAAGLAWGLSAWPAFASDSGLYTIFMAALALGMCSGALVANSSLRESALAYIISAISPFALGFLAGDGGINHALGLMMIIFVGALSVYASKLSKMVSASVQLRGENDALLLEVTQNKERLEQLAAIGEEGVIVSDKLIVLDCNTPLANMVESQPKDMLGKNVLDYVEPKCHDLVKKLYGQGYEGLYEIEIVGARGTRRNVEVVSRYGVYGGRNVRYATIHDITKRKQADDALKLSEERFRSLINSMEDGVFVIDLGYRFVGYYGNWLNNLEVTSEEFVGRTLSEMFGRKDAEIHEKSADIAFKGGPASYEWSLEWNENHVFYHTTLSPLSDPAGEIVGAVGVVRDITAMKQKELEIIAARDEAEKATLLKDKFLSLVAHDLKGPLGSIMASITLIGEDPEIAADKEFRDIIIKTGHGMVQLVDDILNIGRLKTGKITPVFNKVHAREKAVAALGRVANSADKKGVSLFNQIGADVVVNADAQLLEEVMYNLASNSVKFCRKGGDVVFSFEKTESEDVIKVSDTGVGIPPERLSHVFEYHTATSTYGTDGEKGTGLGLPLCGDIVSAHGGSLTAESVLGKGSVFCIRLPKSQSKH